MLRSSLVYLGIFLLLISLLSFINIVYSYYFNLYLNLDSYFPPLFVSLFLGLFLIFYKFRYLKFNSINKIFFVIIGYLLLPSIISLPYYFSIYNISFIDGYFEAVSGFTSTGFTIIDNIKHLDQSLILWRSTSQWIGGLYFLFSIIILIDIFDKSLKNSLTNYLSFNSSEFVRQLSKVFFLYLFLTIIIFFLLKIINFRNLDAFNFALSIISSGGFKPVNEINFLLNKNYKIIVFSFTLLFSFFSIFFSYNIIFYRKKNLNFFTEDFYLLVYLIIISFAFFIFFTKQNFSYYFLSICSSVSNIGIFFSNENSNLYFLYFIMVIIGGSFFSTSSGIRLFKIYTLIKFSINELLSHTKPKHVLLSKVIFNANKVDYDVINKYFLSILIFIISLTTVTALLSITGISFIQSFKLGILTIMNTVNSSLFNLEYFDFKNINVISKSILIIFMIIGRVEFLALILIFKKYLFKN